MSDFEAKQVIHYLESIARNLKDVARMNPDWGHTLSDEVLADNRDWLDCYIEVLKAELPKVELVRCTRCGKGRVVGEPRCRLCGANYELPK